MADNPVQERTEQATPRKLEKAREEGQVACSMELNSVIIVAAGFLSIYVLGPMLFTNMSNLFRQSLSEAPHVVLLPATFPRLFTDRLLDFAVIAGPILLVVAVLALGINVAQVGFLVSFKSLEPKFDRLDPVKGLTRLLSKRSLVQLLRDIVKTIIIALIAYQTISSWMGDITVSGDKTPAMYAQMFGRLALLLAIKISAALLILALFDFAYQRWDFANRQKMTRQEVREEMKDTEGNPVLKGRIRQVQREMARRRMMSEIPKADVVVTNPTHIAVALQYDSETMPAPMVVAKGQRLIAEKIKAVAKEHDIPIVEDKSLARSLFKLVDVGAFIPLELYRAVAEILAYIYRLKEGGVTRG